MKQKSLPTFDELEEALDKTNGKLHPSQAHGLICGILCGKPEKKLAWEALLSGEKISDDTQKALQNLFEVSNKQLTDFLFEFQLILPSDSEELMLRAEALTLWCQGFLTGLKVANIALVNRTPSEMTEAINDLIEIAKMNYEDVVASEEDEVAYVELVEFVRVSSMLIYQDSNEEKSGDETTQSSQQLH